MLHQTLRNALEINVLDTEETKTRAEVEKLVRCGQINLHTSTLVDQRRGQARELKEKETTSAETQMTQTLSGATLLIQRRDGNTVIQSRQLRLNRPDNLLTLETIRSLMFQEERMPKVKPLLFGAIMVRSINNGKSNMLTRLHQFKTKDSWKTSDSTAIDHSISNQECQSIELLNATVLTTSGSEDGERIPLPNSSTSIALQRPLDLNNGRTMLWKSNPTEDQAISE
jgi:hypothetical protein